MKSLAIEREYGTGGWELGKKISEELGIPFYDERSILLEAEKKGKKLSLLKEYEQKKKDSILYNIAMIVDCNNDSKHTTNSALKELFLEIKDTVIDIHNRGPAVFVGGAVSGIVDDKDDFVKIFLFHGNHKNESLHEPGGTKNAFMIRKNKQRSSYYHMMTNKEWINKDNYDYLFDLSKISQDRIQRLLNEKMTR